MVLQKTSVSKCSSNESFKSTKDIIFLLKKTYLFRILKSMVEMSFSAIRAVLMIDHILNINNNGKNLHDNAKTILDINSNKPVIALYPIVYSISVIMDTLEILYVALVLRPLLKFFSSLSIKQKKDVLDNNKKFDKYKNDLQKILFLLPSSYKKLSEYFVYKKYDIKYINFTVATKLFLSFSLLVSYFFPYIAITSFILPIICILNSSIAIFSFIKQKKFEPNKRIQNFFVAFSILQVFVSILVLQGSLVSIIPLLLVSSSIMNLFMCCIKIQRLLDPETRGKLENGILKPVDKVEIFWEVEKFVRTSSIFAIFFITSTPLVVLASICVALEIVKSLYESASANGAKDELELSEIDNDFKEDNNVFQNFRVQYIENVDSVQEQGHAFSS